MMNVPSRFKQQLVAAAFVLLALSGCASFTQDGGFAAVAQTTKTRTGYDLKWIRSDADRDATKRRVDELLQNPLSIDDAVQIALLNNRGLQASFSELGIAEADVVAAGRVPNPHFTLRRARNGDQYTIEQTLTFNLLSVLTIPLKSQMEARRFEQTQRALTMDVLRLASETRKAYILAVAAEENVRYMDKVKTVAESSSELARRMASVGNFNKLSQAREQGFYADAALNHARAAQNQVRAREKLTRVLGLWGADIGFKLPERLPDLPTIPDDLPNVEQVAIAQRLDVQAMKLGTESLAKNLGLSKATRFINVLEIGPTRVLEGAKSDPYKKGFELSLEIPIFDWGSAKVAKAESLYMQSVNRLAEAAVNARSEVRESYQGYRVTYDIAKHYRDEIVPIRKRIADENLLRYNGMLIGVFDLLADARAQITSVNGYIEALRDFWLAKADLDMTMIGKPSMTQMNSSAMTAGDAPAGH